MVQVYVEAVGIFPGADYAVSGSWSIAWIRRSAGAVSFRGYFLSMFFFVFVQCAFRHQREFMEPLVHHIPHTHRQVIPMAPVDRHAFKAIAVVGTGLLAGTMVSLTGVLRTEPFGFFTVFQDAW